MADRIIKILAIDDNQDNLITLKALLNEAFPKAIVFTAFNGQKGIELAIAEDPDVILLDIVMPGMDGFEVCRRLKANKELNDIPVVFVTAIKGDKKHRILALESGAEAFLAKPIEESELTAQVRAMVKIKTANIEKRTEKERLAELVEEQTRELKKTHLITLNLLEDLRRENEARKKSESALLESEKKYRQIAENISDVIWVLNLAKNRLTYISPSIINLRGITVEEAMNESMEEALTPDSIALAKDIIGRILNDLKNSQKSKTYTYEIQQPCKKGNTIWVEESIKGRYNSDGEIEVLGISRNIDERKKQQEELKYLSFHDHLTGLYNRRYYEEELKRLDTERNLPMTIVVADINGLKLINDSFGHAKGDELLKKAAEEMKKVCRDDDIVARLGGDEFVILLPKTDTFAAEGIIKRIKDTSLSEKADTIEISISFGYETKLYKEENIQEILKKAEDQMYRHKVYESSSKRSKTIDLIMNTLFEKSNREMMHSKRVSEICEEIAIHMNLEEGIVNQVRTAGLMHDIGKMGIDEKILNKSQSLDNEEWKEIKRHPEIGYRILSSVNEFSEIASYILEHHERWDGKGYPKGLIGEEISLQARIIAVADACDAMTSDRSYRKGLSEDEAINEIKKCSATQFDPDIAKILIVKGLGKR